MYKMHGKSRIIMNDETLTLERESEFNAAYEDGIAVPQPATPHTFKCNVQPLGGKDLLMVPEADRYKEQYWLWAYPDTAMKTGDRVLRLGKKFEIQSVENWGSYCRARMTLIDVGEYANS